MFYPKELIYIKKYLKFYVAIYRIPSMTTTVNLENSLLEQVIKLYPDKTKKAIIEMGLKELILVNERREIAKLFGAQKDLKIPRRVRK